MKEVYACSDIRLNPLRSLLILFNAAKLLANPPLSLNPRVSLSTSFKEEVSKKA